MIFGNLLFLPKFLRRKILVMFLKLSTVNFLVNFPSKKRRWCRSEILVQGLIAKLVILLVQSLWCFIWPFLGCSNSDFFFQILQRRTVPNVWHALALSFGPGCDTTVAFVVCDQHITVRPCSRAKTLWQHLHFSSHTLSSLQTFLLRGGGN